MIHGTTGGVLVIRESIVLEISVENSASRRVVVE
jgi:hypothetical protein